LFTFRWLSGPRWTQIPGAAAFLLLDSPGGRELIFDFSHGWLASPHLLLPVQGLLFDANGRRCWRGFLALLLLLDFILDGNVAPLAANIGIVLDVLAHNLGRILAAQQQILVIILASQEFSKFKFIALDC